MVIILIFIVFVFGGWSIGKALSDVFLPEEHDDFNSSFKDSNLTIHNHITENHNHLHISKEDLRSLKDSNSQ